MEEQFEFQGRLYAVQVADLSVEQHTHYGDVGPYKVFYSDGRIRLFDCSQRSHRNLLSRIMDHIFGEVPIVESDRGSLDYGLLTFGRDTSNVSSMGSLVKRLRETHPNLAEAPFYACVLSAAQKIVERRKIAESTPVNC